VTYPIRSAPDGDTAWGNDYRAIVAGVNDHQTRVTALEGALASTTRTGNYTITAADVGVEQVFNSASVGTFTLPTDASATIAVGRSIPLRQSGTGQLTIAAAGGVTLASRGTAFKLTGQYAVAEVRKTAANFWVLYGDISV
jgi:hypothetical protein